MSMSPKNQQSTRGEAGEIKIDEIDRKILAELVRDAEITYAELGSRIGLSAPASHERVRRLRRLGVIAGISARINPIALGKPLLAFVHVNTTGWAKNRSLLAIEKYPEVEEIHSVAGDTSMILKVRAPNTQALEDLLAQLYATPGVVSTCSYVVLSSYLERPVQADVTTDWPAQDENAMPVETKRIKRP
jgi:Lrp/AsnC family transcriptional regulator, leucine-responsive regulatory protein